MNTFTSFFNNINYYWFVVRVDREIYNRIFPHLQLERDYGYPFDSKQELLKLCADSRIAALPFMEDIERDIARMPKGYGEAFRYILYRELKACGTMSKSRVKMFKMLARQSIQPETCDLRFIARLA